MPPVFKVLNKVFQVFMEQHSNWLPSALKSKVTVYQGCKIASWTLGFLLNILSTKMHLCLSMPRQATYIHNGEFKIYCRFVRIRTVWHVLTKCCSNIFCHHCVTKMLAMCIYVQVTVLHPKYIVQFFTQCGFSQSYYMLTRHTIYQHDPQSLLIKLMSLIYS